MTTQQKLEALEKKASEVGVSGCVPGTILARTMVQTDNTNSKVYWCLGIGGLQQPKQFFNGDNIEQLIADAEHWLASILHDKATRPK